MFYAMFVHAYTINPESVTVQSGGIGPVGGGGGEAGTYLGAPGVVQPIQIRVTPSRMEGDTSGSGVNIASGVTF